MKKTTRKTLRGVLALLLALVMALDTLPAQAVAEQLEALALGEAPAEVAPQDDAKELAGDALATAQQLGGGDEAAEAGDPGVAAQQLGGADDAVEVGEIDPLEVTVPETARESEEDLLVAESSNETYQLSIQAGEGVSSARLIKGEEYISSGQAKVGEEIALFVEAKDGHTCLHLENVLSEGKLPKMYHWEGLHITDSNRFLYLFEMPPYPVDLRVTCDDKPEYVEATVDADNKLTWETKTLEESWSVPTSRMTEGWYYVNGSKELDSTVEVSGNVRVILRDGFSLSTKGIYVQKGATLTVYGQRASSGMLFGGDYEDRISQTAGIGGKNDTPGGNVTIHGGLVRAYGGDYAAGIGGGDGNSGFGRIVIYGGDVIANGGTDGAGIGGGDENDNDSRGSVAIYGGTVEATGGGYAAGIGGGDYQTGCDVKIYGGEVTAKGGTDAAGIGSGEGRSQWSNISIFDATVRAEGGTHGAGIGAGENGALQVKVTIGGNANVTATGGGDAAGIGGGDEGEKNSNGIVSITGGKVTAEGGDFAAGIGGGDEENGFYVSISGGEVTAKGGDDGAGIGGGENSDGGSVTISKDVLKVTATAGDGAQAIGRGDGGKDSGALDLSEALLKATASETVYTCANRVEAARQQSVELERCAHTEWGENYQDVGGLGHRHQCKFCVYKGEVESHAYDDTGFCQKCSYYKDSGKASQEMVDTTKLTSTNWMSGISDDRLLCEINIPGTHDSSCKDVWSDDIFAIEKYARTQCRYIPQQLQDGVRAFDYRLTNYYDEIVKSGVSVNSNRDLFLTHGDTENFAGEFLYYAKNAAGDFIRLPEGLRYLKDFVENHPTETVLVGLKPEYAPDKAGGKENFYRKLAAVLKDFSEYKTADGRDLLYLENRMPTLAEVRGRIVVMTEDNMLLGESYFGTIGKKCCMSWTSGTKGEMEFVEENHDDADKEDKANYIARFINKYVLPLPMAEETRKQHAVYDYYCKIYTSSNRPPFKCTPCRTPQEIADYVNPIVYTNEDSIFNSYRGLLYGWVMSDYVTEEMARILWLTNYPEETCSITYDYKIDGVANKVVKVAKQHISGERLLPCDKPAPQGKVFAGWRDAESGEVYTPSQTVGGFKNSTFEAVWEDLPSEPVFKSASLVLSGQIGVNFGVLVPQNFEAGDSYMTFEVNGKTTRVNTSSLTKKENKYTFTCYVNSVQMADMITATFHYGEGKTLTKEYSVTSYIDAITTNSSSYPLKALFIVKKLSDYGYYAQKPLAKENGWTLGTDHAEMEERYRFTADINYLRNEKDYNVVKNQVKGYAPVKNLGESKVKASYRLHLDSSTGISVRLEGTSGDTLRGASGSFDGKEYQAVEQDDGSLVIRVSNISAHMLGEWLTITGSTDKGEFTIKVAPLSYVHTILYSDRDDEDKYLLCALYYFYYTVSDYRSYPYK